MTKEPWEHWEKICPNLTDFLEVQVGQDFELFGDTLKEIIANYVSDYTLKTSQKTLSELKKLLPLFRKGKINPDQFLNEINDGKLYEYDDVPTLQYFEDICTFLKKEIEQKMKEEREAV
ncbi:hypothetical protein FAI40_04515 [Acetobacteraceae bacterium]|nr:hypothetical protein FAI40_04515 [Acetobacteraceae bacterium]